MRARTPAVRVGARVAAPAGKEANWVQTVPGKGWFTYFRFYAPTEPFFDKSWALPNLEKA